MYSIAGMFMLWRKKTRDFFDKQIASMGLTLRLLHLATNALGTSLSRPLLAVNARARAVFTTVLMQALLPLDRLVRVAPLWLDMVYSHEPLIYNREEHAYSMS